MFGLKPSTNRVSWGSSEGLIWEGASANGVLTRSVRDAAVMLDIIRLAKARRPADPISWISASIKARAVGKPTFEEKMMEAVGLDARKGVAGPIIDHSQAELLVLE